MMLKSLGWSLAFGCVVLGPPPQDQQRVFRSGVDLITLDVRVTDRDGRPVPGLGADDFVVTLGGRRSPVRVVDYLVFGSTSTDTVNPGSRVTTNASADATRSSRGGRVILFVFDDLSAQPAQLAGLKAAVERGLGTLDRDDLVGLVTTSGLGPSVSPTRDRELLLSALHRRDMVGRADSGSLRPFVTIREAVEGTGQLGSDGIGRAVLRECVAAKGDVSTGGIESSRAGTPPQPLPDEACARRLYANARMLAIEADNATADQMAAYVHAIQALSQAPAPRVLVALTGGLALPSDRTPPLDEVSRAAADSDVAFYAVVAGREEIDLSDDVIGRSGARAEERDYLVGGMQSMAIAAGGEAVRVVGQADRFLSRVIAQTSAMYRLGVDAPAGPSAHYLSAKVSVNRSGLTVQTNSRTVSLTPPIAVPVDKALRARLQQGGVAFGVPLSLAAAVRRDPDRKRVQVVVSMRVPAVTAGPLTASFALLTATGHIIEAGSKNLPSIPDEDYQLTLPLSANEGDYRLRVAVADSHGNIGSLEREVAAHLQHLNGMTVSDLLLTIQAGRGVPHVLASERLPVSTTTVQATLEIYPSAPGPAVTVRFALSPMDTSSPAVEHEFLPKEGEGQSTVAASLPVGGLPPGRYQIRAEVLRSGVVIGTVSTVFRKIQD